MKQLAVIVGFVVAAMALTTVASASHTEYGRLWSEGTGTSELEVGEARIQMYVDGDVTISGPADLEVLIDGRDRLTAPQTEDTTIELTNFEGEIRVRGADYTVVVEGEIRMRGEGWGSAQFIGEGRWKTLHRQGLWPASLPQPMVDFGAPPG